MHEQCIEFQERLCVELNRPAFDQHIYGSSMHLNTSAIHTIIKPLEGKQDLYATVSTVHIQYDMAESIIRRKE